MADQPKVPAPEEPAFLPRDGTSQKGRALPALDPASVRVDERTVQDLVAFAREIGKDETLIEGGWNGFIGSLDPADVAAFLEEPGRFDPIRSPELFRPHFVLFLAFLRLYQRAQRALNAIPQRHLDFYYRRVLQMASKGPVADRVHLIFDLARGEREIEIPAGTPVSAGPDRLGRDQVYKTERPIIVNRIQIAKKHSVFVERRRTGFPEIRARLQAERLAAGQTATSLELFLETLRIVLGDALPKFPDAQEMTTALLEALAAQAGEDQGFYLSVSELADLVRLDALSDTQLDEQAKQDQQANIKAILDLSVDRQQQLGRSPQIRPSLSEVVAYWRNLEGYFRMPPEQFHEIMGLLANEPDQTAWKRVDVLLESAHQRKIREDRINRLRDIHEAHLEAGLVPLVREALGDDSATEFSLDALLDESQRATLAQAQKDGNWESIYSLLELAQRNRYGERPVQQVEWSDLIAAEDATAVVRPTPDGQGSSGRWATFGMPRPADRSDTPAPVVGWAISSPLLWLREGTRVITLTLKLHELPTNLPLIFTVNPLSCQLSTAKGWIECPSVEVRIDSFATLAGDSSGDNSVGLQLKLTLDATMDPIAPLPPRLAETSGPGPMLRLMLQPIRSGEGEPFTTRYEVLASLSIVAVHLKVDASELRAQRLQNDERVLDPKKPFEPFGSAPAVGSRLLIGHPEIAGKTLDSLTLGLEWMGKPAKLGAHYANYTLPDGTQAVNVANLKVEISMIDRGEERSLTSLPLLTSDSLEITSLTGSGAAAPELLSAVALPEELSDWRRYLQVELAGSDFGHTAYPAIAASKAVDLAAAIAHPPPSFDPANYKVNPPYTPKLKSLTLTYTSTLSLPLTSPPDPVVARVLHVHPFGYCDVHREQGARSTPNGVPLLPRYDNDGELYLGLADVAPPQSVSLLFELAEGSADPDLPPQPVTWSYLDGDRWVPFGHRVQDFTGGLISSGIIELALDPVAPSTRLGGGLYWIRAAVEQNTKSISDTIDIHPQAVPAVFVDHDNAPEHFREPLPPEKIKKLGPRIKGIAGVRQPYASHGGRPAEDPDMWATRVSERLRHKQRALSMWDYERLVLEHFPQVYKARCLPARAEAPGRVELVVIPDIRNRFPFDPFEPKAPSSLLREIETYLRDKTPDSAEVVARNPRYVSVRVSLAVRFTGDGNDAFYTRKLNDDLNRFLSPWAFEEGSDIVLGGRIYVNSIVDFVDRRDYVDYVASVKLARSEGGGDYHLAPAPPEGEGDFVAAGYPDAILVAARTHEIKVIKTGAYDEASMSGINFMKVEFDFIVAPS